MLAFDAAAIHFLNAYSTVSRSFDGFVVAMSYNGLFKAAPVLGVIWWHWFVRDERTAERRTALVSVMLAGIVGAAISVVLSRTLPARPRPLIDPTVGFVRPLTMVAEGWERASSLPSDHASLFIALSVGLFAVSRTWGLVALLHSVLFVCLPRAYLGLHYVSDLLAGGLIGVACAYAFNTARVRDSLSRRVVALEARAPQVFYPAFLLVSYQIADLFVSSRDLGRELRKLLSGGA